MNDADYMRIAIELAKNGRGWENPNPMVGAVIVKDDKIIGAGYHRKCGEFHAERNAFASLTESAEGATIYVTLEPCCHYGKQPPCALAIIEHKIGRVVIGSRDPNPLVAGKGANLLREHGITVEEDFLREECDKLNPVFFHYITTKQPYVVMKYAMTMDGKIATRTGASKWITGEEARKYVHIQRSSYAAIMAGIGTVLADDPMLNARIEGEAADQAADTDKNIDNDIDKDISVNRLNINAEEYRAKLDTHQPVRIIVDSKLRIPFESNIVKSASEYETIIACAHVDTEQKQEKKEKLEKLGIKVVSFADSNGQVELGKLMSWLGEEKIDSVYIEGGGTLHEAAMKAGIVNHVFAFIAPKMFGGNEAKTPVEGGGVEKVEEAMQLRVSEVRMLGNDVLIDADVVK